MPPPASMSDTISGFDPRSIGGCQLWLDATDTSSLTGSSPVTAWRDKSVSLNSTTSVAGTNVLTQSAINGSPAISLSGSSSLTGSITGSGTTLTVCIVGTQSNGCATNGGLVCLGRSGQLDYADAGSVAITQISSGNMVSTRNSVNSQTTNTGLATPFIYIVIYDGTYVNTYYNGRLQTTANISISGTFAYTNYVIGNRAGSTTNVFWTGFIGEVLVYQSSLTTSQRQAVEGYLAYKWGLQTNSSSFIPTSITGCQLWLDGADRGSTSMNLTGTSVTLWKDKAGVSTTTLGGTAPTLSTSGPSGVFFPGTGYFTTTYTASPVNETLFIVFNTTSALYTAYNPIIGSSATGGRSYSLQNGSPLLGYLSESIAWGAITSFVIGTITLAEGTYTGTTESVTVNGGAFVTTTQSFTAGRVSHIGASSSGSYFFKGTLYEIIAYNSVLSTTQRQQVEAYLARKWTVSVPTQVLPITHTSYLARPFSRRFNVVDFTLTPEYWFDAADINTIAVSGNFLTTWTNKGSFTGSNITPTTANTTTSGTTRFNGNNLISIPSANRLQYTGYFPNNARARFFVTRQTAAGSVIYLYQGYNSINGYDYVAIEANTIIEVWGLQASLPVTHPYYKFSPSSAIPFLPTNLSGCTLWLDGADSSTIIRSGVNMTQWNDKSGLANNMIPFSTFSNATVMSNYWNGLNVLNFSGVAVYQAPASSAVYPIDVYIVLALKDLTTHVDVFSLTPSAAVDNFNNLGFSEYITSRWYNGSSGFSRTPNTASTTNETSTSFLLMNWSIANNNYVIRRNGTQLSQTASYTWTMTTGSIFQLGWRISPLIFSPGSYAGAFRGYIGEIVAFNSQLSTANRQKVEGYLASKWGLTSSLPTIHPYRQFEPAQESYIPVAAYSNFLWTRFYNITSDPSINGPGSSGWGALIGTAGAYDPINFHDSDGRIGQSDYVGVISKGFMYSATTTVVTFRTNSDDGIVVFFNGANVLQNWTYHGDTINNSASVTLPAGYTPIELRFFEWGGGFTCELYWSVGSTGTYVSAGTGVMFHNDTSKS